MRIDLHAHTCRSDGTQTPRALVEAAAAAGLDVLGLTDHDTTSGWDEALTAADGIGVRVVPGLEISARHGHRGVHLLAYLVDPAYPPLLTALARILDGRSSRVPAILARLREVGVELTAVDVRRCSDGAAALGRPHIADAMVQARVVASRDEAFARFLNPGRPGYVDRYAAPVTDMLAVVREAGGVAVLAHPWGRHGRGLGEPELAALQAQGLTGIEVDHQDHDPSARAALRAIAGNLDLVVTGSSDHHGTGKVGHDLGCNTTSPEEFERLLAARPPAPATDVLGRGG